MKKFGKNRIVLFVLSFVLLQIVIFGAFFKYSEEIADFKMTVYDALRTYRASSQTESAPELDPSEIPARQHTGTEWYFDADLIYHACGGINGLDYSNSREALEASLSAGNRYIEVDFDFTSDDELVCIHDWEQSVFESDGRMDMQSFEKAKIYGKYTPLSGKAIVEYLKAYPDLYIVVDTKNSLPRVIRSFLTLTDSGEVLNRLIIQLYGPGEKAEIQAIYPFPDENFLLTVYKRGDLSAVSAMAVCSEENISVITAPVSRFTDEGKAMLREKNFVLYEHTVNRPDIAERELRKGTRGFYTDFLSEDDLKQEYVVLLEVN